MLEYILDFIYYITLYIYIKNLPYYNFGESISIPLYVPVAGLSREISGLAHWRRWRRQEWLERRGAAAVFPTI